VTQAPPTPRLQAAPDDATGFAPAAARSGHVQILLVEDVPQVAERDRRALASLRAAGIPVCVTLAGGYGRPLDDTAAIHAATIAAAATCR
jgi:hypothetical protein